MNSIKKKYREILRYSLNKHNREKLYNKNISLFCNNCTGGGIYHDLGLQFLSPTINLYFSAGDYVTFLERLDYFLEADLTQIYIDEHFPVGKLGNELTLNFVHYKTFEQAKEKWLTRCKRINKDNMFFILIDRDGCTIEIAKRFDSLPFKNKVILTYREMPDISCAFVKPEWEDCGKTRVLTEYLSKFSGKRYIDAFDYVSFLNGEDAKK